MPGVHRIRARWLADALDVDGVREPEDVGVVLLGGAEYESKWIQCLCGNAARLREREQNRDACEELIQTAPPGEPSPKAR